MCVRKRGREDACVCGRVRVCVCVCVRACLFARKMHRFSRDGTVVATAVVVVPEAREREREREREGARM